MDREPPVASKDQQRRAESSEDELPGEAIPGSSIEAAVHPINVVTSGHRRAGLLLPAMPDHATNFVVSTPVRLGSRANTLNAA